MNQEAQALPDLVENIKQFRVEIADGRPGKGAKNARMDRGRAGAKQQARFGKCLHTPK